MSEPVVVSWLKGNYGEHLVAQILSRSCFVRPVVGHTDIGIDLYCESIIDSNPFLHFFAQVKSSKDFTNEAAQISCPFPVSALQYWARQPVPVLGFLVPTQWPPENIHYIHVVDITFEILESGLAVDQKTQTLKSNPELILPISDQQKLLQALQSLLIDHMPMVVSAMYAEKGFIYPAPKPHAEDVSYFAGHFLSRYIPKIELATRRAVTFGIMQYINAGRRVEDLPKFLLSALETLKDDLHFDVQEALGLVNQSGGNLKDAKVHYENAIRCISENRQIDSKRRPWPENIERLRQRIDSLEGKSGVES